MAGRVTGMEGRVTGMEGRATGPAFDIEYLYE
jgi:hypothetical protein